MAADATSLSAITSFTTATDAASKGLPESTTLLPPEAGISLLDAKNDIFLAYLQALALRNLSVIRGIKDGASLEDTRSLSDKLTRKLVEHRVYLERGVRPLEQRIKYQVDKVVKAAEDEDRAALQKAQALTNGRFKTRKDKTAASDEDEDDSDEDDGEDGDEIDELSYRPNPAAFALPKAETNDTARKSKSQEDGVYRPPRISATAMPTTEQKERRDRKPQRSAAVDEYINTELSTLPTAEPSIGSTITEGGRRTKNARDLREEKERQEYEETNLVRLPKESKKEQGRKQGRDRGGFGGEEWKGLGDSLNRIGDLTRKKGRDNVLDKSRKRRATEDGPRGDGIGEAFDMKKRRMDKKSRR